MKYKTKLSDAIHILALIALDPYGTLKSESIAESIRTNPAYIRQIMSRLRNEGLINCVKGKATPTLAKEPREITLLQIYRAIEGDNPILHQDTHTNPECGVGVNIQHVIRDCYDIVQQKAEEAMGDITLEDILDRFGKKLENFGEIYPWRGSNP